MVLVVLAVLFGSAPPAVRIARNMEAISEVRPVYARGQCCVVGFDRGRRLYEAAIDSGSLG